MSGTQPVLKDASCHPELLPWQQHPLSEAVIPHGAASVSLHNLRGAQRGPLASKGPSPPEPWAQSQRPLRGPCGYTRGLLEACATPLTEVSLGGKLRQTAWRRLACRRHLCRRDASVHGHRVSLTQAAAFQEPGGPPAQLKRGEGQPCTQHLRESPRRLTALGVLVPAFLKGPLTRHTGKHQGSMAAALGEEMVLS